MGSYARRERGSVGAMKKLPRWAIGVIAVGVLGAALLAGDAINRRLQDAGNGANAPSNGVGR